MIINSYTIEIDPFRTTQYFGFNGPIDTVVDLANFYNGTLQIFYRHQEPFNTTNRYISIMIMDLTDLFNNVIDNYKLIYTFYTYKGKLYGVFVEQTKQDIFKEKMDL